ncbi:FUSC family protein [Anaerotruncus sp. DFI.9.16]|uniref:FUSC family protein n=1 Tax=Anaerotruncus sp. DFI.9.16 TaxID=2965275 RepID=UPI00210A6E58|nr:FUSC family protein [Anaerotruncus sp. DFI.9.16]MCQ4896382.1 FUSC family protein [Anaerotruncus sp. DFI.9.16]
MQENRKKFSRFALLALENAARFAFNLGFVILFQLLFGADNTLTGVAIGVGLTLFPMADYGIRPLTMAGIILGLLVGGGAAAQLALAAPWIALPLYFLFTLLLMALTCEPAQYKPSIVFLLTFVFCQATPVPAADFPRRMLGITAAGALVAAVSLLCWRRRGWTNEGRRTLGEQLRFCCTPRNRGLILRMSVGLALAMFIGMELHLKKPLWISIVVMSLTQLEFHDTLQRIKHRTVGTVLGGVLFVVVFQLLVPQEYGYWVILLLGYLSFFTPKYKHKQIVNAVNAINASMVLFDATAAIRNRVLCLFGGIAIVLLLYLAESRLRPLWRKLHAAAYHPQDGDSLRGLPEGSKFGVFSV